MGSSLFKALFILSVFALVNSVSSQSVVCPFDYLYHLGDGAFDNGNSIVIEPNLPAARWPYGITYPGKPTGRWCDGLLDIDIGATAMGFPVLAPYLGGSASSNNAIIFAVARSPVLSRSFFASREVSIPPYATPLDIQLCWFKKHIHSICSTPEGFNPDCPAKVLGRSLILFGDVEANDITFPLLQGKLIQEVKTYVSEVNRAQIDAAKELIKMGATRVILTGNVPIGCYPFILTELGSIDQEDYDDLGCLKKINDLIVYKNNDLKDSIVSLKKEFPHIIIFYADFYGAFRKLLQETISGSNKREALKACCGIGGEYNYDSRSFCGSPGVPVCSDPNKYIYWDGIHLTEKANIRLSQFLQEDAKGNLDCKINLGKSLLSEAEGVSRKLLI